MSRIEERFRELKERGEKGLVLYLTAGDPDLETSLELLLCAASSGADVIELGIPFSDPMADGPVIQRAFMRSLGSGFRTKDAFRLVREFRKYFSTPLVLFGYVNPIIAYGPTRFFRDAVRAGVDGILAVDLPLEEWEPFREEAVKSGLDWIGLVAPTSGIERIRLIGKKSSGFIYVISVTGITGMREKLPAEYVKIVKSLRKETSLPVVVGFGISTPEMAQEVASVCDGVVVGSAAVRLVEEHGKNKEKLLRNFSSFVEKMKLGMQNGVV
ncbi:MAG: tryptophan synthase subunit alpha [Deltaproteobacteria bacterium]|nr:MAG: tryptophan synthase subunit alpha [Deltaproteobacteria bacterium]